MNDLLLQLFPEIAVAKESKKSTARPFPVDIYEDEESYGLEAYFPGYSKEDVSVETDKGVLTISAKKKSKRENLRVSELGYKGDLERSFRLADDVDTENISASLKNGVLYVTINKVESKKPKEIKIK
jgi:HSP20 family protein